MQIQVKGKFIAAAKYVQHTDSFGSQKFYVDITDNPEYPNQAEFQVPNQKVNLDNFKKGDDVEVSCNLRGRKVQSKKDGKEYFIQNLDAWKVVVSGSNGQGSYEAPPISPEDDDDDLPF